MNWNGFLFLGADIFDRAQEAGGIGGSKKLIGIETIVLAAHFLGLADLEVDHAIGGYSPALAAASG